jgi:hypothetical protein
LAPIACSYASTSVENGRSGRKEKIRGETSCSPQNVKVPSTPGVGLR